jgi:ubiquitin-like-conjugating enzyme ATG3
MQVVNAGTGEENDQVFDLDDLSDGDDNMFAQPAAQQEESKGGEIKIIKARKYDLSITYDFYTQTPRLWLTGFSENGTPLNQDEIFEDIDADYAKKTVTMESHMHSGIK